MTFLFSHPGKNILFKARTTTENAETSLRRVAKLAGKALLALIATGLASHFTIADLEIALQTENCVCGEFAPLVFLPTLTKACLRCLEWHHSRPEFKGWWLDDADREMLASKNAEFREGSQYRIMHTLAGRYGCAFLSYQESRHERKFYVAGKSPPEGISSRSCIAGYSQVYVTATTMPYVDGNLVTSSRVCPGVRCTGCDGRTPPRCHKKWHTHPAAERRYSFDGYLKHFQWCLEAQRIWNLRFRSSDRGGSRR